MWILSQIDSYFVVRCSAKWVTEDLLANDRKVIVFIDTKVFQNVANERDVSFQFYFSLTHWSRYPGVYYTCYWCAVPISLFVPDLRNCSCHVVKKRNETSWIFDLLLYLSQFCFSFSQDEPNSCLVCVCVWGKLLSRKAPCLRLYLT